ncbi:condensation domain-containing protein [Photorhabdus akhurstii]|uniref:condensation domain-containing protein n=1 Tax=Photorhabdus akhurstii TaxID=171438 RepID=UPI0037044455
MESAHFVSARRACNGKVNIMRVQLGQLYDLRYSLNVDQLCVGEVLMPLERLEPAHLKVAIEYILNKYSVLRARFIGNGMDMKMDFVPPDSELLHQAFEVREQTDSPCDRRRLISNYIAEVRAAMNLANPPLLRYCLFDGNCARDQRLVLIFNHLVCDGISSRILWRDLSKAYRMSVSGQPLALESATNYEQFCAELYERHRQIVKAVIPDDEQQIEQPTLNILGGRSVESLPISRLSEAVTEIRQLDGEALNRIRLLAKRHRVSVADLLLGSWLKALAAVFGKGSLNMLLWVSPHFVGYWETSVANLVGSVSFPITVKFNIDPEPSLDSTLQHAVQEFNNAMEKAADYAATYLVPNSIFGWPELPAISFNFVGDQRRSPNVIGYELSPEKIRIGKPDEDAQEIPLSMDIEIYADMMEVTISSRPDCHLQILPPRLMDLWLEMIGELGIEQPFFSGY